MCPHINLSSRYPWNQLKVDFVKNQHSLQEEIERIRHVSTVTTDITWSTSDSRGDESDFIFSLSDISRKIVAMGVTRETEKVDTYPPQEILQRPNEGSVQSDIKYIPTFQSTGRHTDTSPEDLSQRWHISVSRAIKTLKHATHKLLRSAILPLSQRYRSDQMFDRETLARKWSTDTMDSRSKTISGNRYAQVFSNDKYFAKSYPM